MSNSKNSNKDETTEELLKRLIEKEKNKKLFKESNKILKTLKPGERKAFTFPDCNGTAYCGKSDYNGHEYVFCPTCKRGIQA